MHCHVLYILVFAKVHHLKSEREVEINRVFKTTKKVGLENLHKLTLHVVNKRLESDESEAGRTKFLHMRKWSPLEVLDWPCV